MVAKTKAKTAPAPTMGALIDSIWAAREEKRRLDAQVKKTEAAIAELQTQLMERMEAEGTDKAQGSKASVTISKNVVANVTDWDELWPYIAKNKFYGLVQRRVNDLAYRELLDLGKKVPGVEPFTKRALNVRSL
jgi:hypothetical protein